MLSTATRAPRARKPRKADHYDPTVRADANDERCPDCGASYQAFRSGEDTAAMKGWIWASVAGVEMDPGLHTDRNVDSETRAMSRQIKRNAWAEQHGPGRCVAEMPRPSGWALSHDDRAANLETMLDAMADEENAAWWLDSEETDATFDVGAFDDAPKEIACPTRGPVPSCRSTFRSATIASHRALRPRPTTDRATYSATRSVRPRPLAPEEVARASSRSRCPSRGSSSSKRGLSGSWPGQIFDLHAREDVPPFDGRETRTTKRLSGPRPRDGDHDRGEPELHRSTKPMRALERVPRAG